MKKVFFFALLISAALLTSTPAISGTWKVHAPSDLPFMNCFIMFENNGGSDTGDATISPGGTGTWGTKTALSYIHGRCTKGSGYSPVQVQGRTCTGIDYQSGVAGGIRCSIDVLKLKICPKVSNPSTDHDYQYGFCPE